MNHFWKLVTKTRILSKEMMIIRQKPVPNYLRRKKITTETTTLMKKPVNLIRKNTQWLCIRISRRFVRISRVFNLILLKIQFLRKLIFNFQFIENKRLWSQETGSVHPGAAESSGTPVRMLADQLETQLSHWSGSVSRNCLTRAGSRGEVLTEYSDLQLLIPDRDNVGE